MEEISSKCSIEDKANWLTSLTLVFSFGALIVSVFGLTNSYKVTDSEYRPYIGISSVRLVNISDSYFEVNILYKNTGKVPANDIVVKGWVVLENGDLGLIQDDTIRSGVIAMPAVENYYQLRPTKENGGLNSIISSDHGLQVKLEISYSGIDVASSTKRYVVWETVRFDKILNVSDIIAGYAN